MPEFRHRQSGIFHVTTNTNDGLPWCTLPNIPRILIDHLVMAKNAHDAKLYAFCILSNHMHIIMSPGKKGLSRFMQSFKSHTTKAVNEHVRRSPDILRQLEHDAMVKGCGTAWSGRGIPATEGITIRAIQWQSGFYDSRIDGSYQSAVTLSYVRNNALNHRLVNDPLAWPWSSLRFPELTDALPSWLE